MVARDPRGQPAGARLILVALCMSLAACAGRAPASPIVCPEPVRYTTEQEAHIGFAIAQLERTNPDGAQALADYHNERMRLWRCRGETPP